MRKIKKEDLFASIMYFLMLLYGFEVITTEGKKYQGVPKARRSTYDGNFLVESDSMIIFCFNTDTLIG